MSETLRTYAVGIAGSEHVEYEGADMSVWFLPGESTSKPPSKLILRLFAALRRAGLDVPDTARFSRVYAGRLQRREGAWSWEVDVPGMEIGSSYTVAECVAAASLEARRTVALTWEVSVKEPP